MALFSPTQIQNRSKEAEVGNIARAMVLDTGLGDDLYFTLSGTRGEEGGRGFVDSGAGTAELFSEAPRPVAQHTANSMTRRRGGSEGVRARNSRGGQNRRAGMVAGAQKNIKAAIDVEATGDVRSNETELSARGEKKKKATGSTAGRSVFLSTLEKRCNEPGLMTGRLTRQEVEALKDKSVGKGWFDLEAPEMTEEVKNDLKVLKLRGVANPNRFYKSADAAPKYFARGTIIEGAGEFYSARLTRKQRRRNMVEELLADQDFALSARRRHLDIDAAKQAAAGRAGGKRSRKASATAGGKRGSKRGKR